MHEWASNPWPCDSEALYHWPAETPDFSQHTRLCNHSTANIVKVDSLRHSSRLLPPMFPSYKNNNINTHFPTSCIFFMSSLPLFKQYFHIASTKLSRSSNDKVLLKLEKLKTLPITLCFQLENWTPTRHVKRIHHAKMVGNVFLWPRRTRPTFSATARLVSRDQTVSKVGTLHWSNFWQRLLLFRAQKSAKLKID